MSLTMQDYEPNRHRTPVQEEARWQRALTHLREQAEELRHVEWERDEAFRERDEALERLDRGTVASSSPFWEWFDKAKEDPMRHQRDI